MNEQTMDRSLRLARVAGVAYLLVIVAGIFAEFVVRSRLIVHGDAAATAANITASESLFRFGVVGDGVELRQPLEVARELGAHQPADAVGRDLPGQHHEDDCRRVRLGCHGPLVVMSIIAFIAGSSSIVAG